MSRVTVRRKLDIYWIHGTARTSSIEARCQSNLKLKLYVQLQKRSLFVPIMRFGKGEIASVTATLMSGQNFVNSCVGRWKTVYMKIMNDVYFNDFNV